ncbi:MAG: site-specific integrase [Chloroflexota bacterium]|nr:site-specific integrase [Chloroflexota bacterium]
MSEERGVCPKSLTGSSPDVRGAAIQHYLSAVIHLAAYTGLRRGELAGLTWKNVKLNAGYLSVVQSLVVTAHGVKLEPPKTRAGLRDVDLDLDTVALLRRHRNAQCRSAKALGIEPPEMVFPKQDWTDWCRPTVIARVVSRWAERAGCPKLTLHSLCHFHASMLLQSGVNPSVVAERLGHSNPAITMSIYAHCLPGWQRGAADAFSDLIREAA